MKNIVTEGQRRKIRTLIREEFIRKQIINEHVNSVYKKMEKYEIKSLNEGLSQENINNGLMVIINEGFMDVGFDMIKKYLGGKLLSFLGLDESKDPVLYGHPRRWIVRVYTKFYMVWGQDEPKVLQW